MMAKRTTVTLEDDVLEQLTAHVRHTGRPLRAVLNDAIRRGLDRPLAPPTPLRIEAGDLGAQPGIEFDDISALLELAEGPMLMDAHLAALAIEHGATLCTTDRDFARYPGLRLANPLAI